MPVLEFRSRRVIAPIGSPKAISTPPFASGCQPSVNRNMKAIKREQRAMVRKEIQNGLRSEVDRDGGLHPRPFQSVFATLGTPVFPSGNISSLLLAACSRACQHKHHNHHQLGGKPVASVLNFYFSR